MKDQNENHIKEEYILITDENNKKIIKKSKQDTKKEINLIFENEEETNIMESVIKQLTKYYIEDILKVQM